MPGTSVKTRLQEFLKESHLSQTDFCRMLGVSNTYVGAMRKGIPADKLKKICELFPDLNRDWLIYGEGSMLLSKKGEDKEKKSGISPDHEVPLLPAEAFAGGLEKWSSGAKRDECQRMVSPLGGADFAITLRGDSMEPRYHDGATLIIKKINDKAFIPWGHPMVIDTENGVYIKNLLPDGQDSNTIPQSRGNAEGDGKDDDSEKEDVNGANNDDKEKTEKPEFYIASSINPKYPPFRIPKSSIFGIYRVMGAIDFSVSI